MQPYPFKLRADCSLDDNCQQNKSISLVHDAFKVDIRVRSVSNRLSVVKKYEANIRIKTKKEKKSLLYLFWSVFVLFKRGQCIVDVSALIGSGSFSTIKFKSPSLFLSRSHSNIVGLFSVQFHDT